MIQLRIPRISKKAYALLFILLLIVGVLLTVYQAGQKQQITQRAAPLACLQAICRWDALMGASEYKVVVTDMETGSVIKSETVLSSSSLQVLFPIQAAKTYQCQVTAVNPCGPGPVAKTQTTCPIETVVTTTVAPTATIAPTTTVAPTAAIPTTTVSPSPAPITLKVTKVVINDNGGTKVVDNFPLFVDGTSVTSGVANTTFLVGNHTISETNQTGYIGTISGDCSVNGSITLAAGDNKTCTITNNDIAPLLTVIKVINGGTLLVSNFPLFVDGSSVTSGISTSTSVGVHAITETNQANYTASFSSNCLQGQITLQAGDVKTCTITNTFQAPPTPTPVVQAPFQAPPPVVQQPPAIAQQPPTAPPTVIITRAPTLVATGPGDKIAGIGVIGIIFAILGGLLVLGL